MLNKRNDANQIANGEILTVGSEYTDQRLDNFLLRELKSVPKSHIYKMLRKRTLRVNGKRAKPDYRLQSGDAIRLPASLCGEGRKENANKPKPASSTLQLLQHKIIYEDESLIVLNKPSGMAAHGGSGINFGVIETMRLARPDARYLELVHRLDRETSGCMLLAKKRSMLRILHELLRESGVQKKYLLLVKGKWRGGAKKVEATLRKNQLQSGERMVLVSADGKRAATTFRPLQTFECDGVRLSLLEAELHTGRTHQIRVHAAHLGFPLAGDEKYGDAEFNKFMRQHGLRRLFLHAAEIKFRLPNSVAPMIFSASLPDDLAKIIVSKEMTKFARFCAKACV